MKKIQFLFDTSRTLTQACTVKTGVVFAGSIAANISLVLCSVFSPILLMNAMTPAAAISGSFGLIAGVLVIKGVCEYMECVMEKLVQTTCSQVNFRLERMLAEKFTHIPYAYMQDAEFLNLHSGAHFALVNYKSVENLMKAAVSIVCQSLVLLLGGGFLLFKFPILVLFLASGFGVQFLINAKLNEKLEVFFNQLFPINRRYRWLNSLKFDASRQKDIRAYHMETQIENKLAQYNKESSMQFSAMNHISCGHGCVADAFGNLTMYAGFVYNTVLLFQGKMDIGLFMSLNTLLLRCSSILNSIGDSIMTGSQMLNYMKPVVKTLAYPADSRADMEIGNIVSVEFQNVSFSYPGSENYVLKNLSFRLDQGEKVGLVGINGSGKTTIIKLLCGLYTPTEGKILVNDIDIAQFNLEKYYAKMGVVLQDFNILDFSIKENIALSNAEEDAKLQKVAADVGLADLIEQLHDKMNTKLGPKTNDKGIALSGGQLQKIAIARALYTEKDLYIFDEPDSNIDPVAERALYQQYDRLIQGKLTIFVSHRLKSLDFCSRVIVVENGCIG